MTTTSYPLTPGQPSPVMRRGALVVAAGLCLVAVVAIWVLLTGHFDDTTARVLLSGLASALCTLGGLAGASALRAEKVDRRVGEATIGLSQLTLLTALALIWIPDAPESETLFRALGVTSTMMLAGAHASLLMARSRNLDTGTIRGLTRAAIACATSAALLVCVLFTAIDGPVPSAVWRLLGLLVVLALLNTLLVPLARKIIYGGGRPERDEAIRANSNPPTP
jgi:hypothetical protein